MGIEIVPSWTVPLVLFFISLLFLYGYGTWPLSTWRQLGIPGPTPVAFFGNAMQLQRKGVLPALLEWRKTYGKVYGIYMFRRPFLMTSDVDILREVLIKNFSNFNTRENIAPLVVYPTSQSLVCTSGEVWRRQRLTMNPTFSASKMKYMSTYISRCCKNLVSVIDTATSAGTPLDVKKIFGSYTLDVIAGTAFGLDTNCLAGEENAFLNSVRQFFTHASQPSRIGLLVALFPVLRPLFVKLRIRGDKAGKDMAVCVRTLRSVIEERKAETVKGKGPVDMLQLMLESEAREEDVTANPQDRKLTKDEILAQGWVFFIGGYESTASTLQYLSYLLAVNPDKQQKLYNEIIAVIGDAELSYEKVMAVRYLDNCISEALRCFPPGSMFGRRTVETRTIKGVTIPAGSSVIACVYAVTQDEDYFPEPGKFIPERFEGDKKIPSLLKDIMFGAGPRQCIGMRLALYEIKTAFVSVVRKFKFVKVKDTPEVISFQKARLSLRSKPILVGTEPRE